MKRNQIRVALWTALLISSLFALWVWFRPYDWRTDSAARGRITGVSLTRDHQNHWCDVRVHFPEDHPHDLLKAVWLQTADGKRMEPANTTLTQPSDRGQDVVFRFWLEPEQLKSTLSLHLNQGSLRVKSTLGEISMADRESRYFTHHAW